MIFLDDKNSKVLNFELLIQEQKIILTAQSDDKGMIKDTIDKIQMIHIDEAHRNQKNLIININAYYLYEILKSIKSDEIFFGLNNEKSPAALSDKTFEEKFYLLMPMIT
jgi:DNA polymerase III sliding clamp (beta) subunit (PCNA family)